KRDSSDERGRLLCRDQVMSATRCRMPIAILQHESGESKEAPSREQAHCDGQQYGQPSSDWNAKEEISSKEVGQVLINNGSSGELKQARYAVQSLLREKPNRSCPFLRNPCQGNRV